MAYFESRRQGHCQSDQYWNCLKSNSRVTSKRRGGVHIWTFLCTKIPSWTELHYVTVSRRAMQWQFQFRNGEHVSGVAHFMHAAFMLAVLTSRVAISTCVMHFVDEKSSAVKMTFLFSCLRYMVLNCFISKPTVSFTQKCGQLSYWIHPTNPQNYIQRLRHAPKLKWPSLQKRRSVAQLMFYKVTNWTRLRKLLQTPTIVQSRSRRGQRYSRIPCCTRQINRSFFLMTIWEWNLLDSNTVRAPSTDAVTVRASAKLKVYSLLLSFCLFCLLLQRILHPCKQQQ